MVPLFISAYYNLDKYGEYIRVRGSIGLAKESLLPINATSSMQVCENFGIHHKLPFLKELYDQNELAFLAGIGVLTAPANKRNYDKVTETQLFSHNKMREEIKKLDPFKKISGSGVLGRLLDAISTQKGSSVQAFAIDSDMIPIGGTEVGLNKAAVNSKIGFKPFNQSPVRDNDAVYENFELLNGIQESHGSMNAETWSSSLVRKAYSHFFFCTLMTKIS